MNSLVRRQTLGDLLRRSASRSPEKLAIVCGETRWTYRQFNAIVDRLAAGLAERGVVKGERVAILARNSHAFAALRFALARLGAVLVPINFMLKPDEVAYILRHAGARMLATNSGLAPVARAAREQVSTVEHLIWLPSEGRSEVQGDMIDFHALAESRAAVPEVDLDGTDVAQIVYTSGTESAPKGAMLTHDAVIWQYVSCVIDAGIAEDDLMLHALPLYHCAQLDVFLGPAIYVGATNIITAFPTPDNLLPLIEKYRISSFFAPPTVWISLLRSPLVRNHGPFHAAQGLLRGLDHAGRGLARAGTTAAQGPPLESLWPDRNRAARDPARAGGPAAQARVLRTRGDQCRDPRGG